MNKKFHKMKVCTKRILTGLLSICIIATSLPAYASVGPRSTTTAIADTLRVNETFDSSTGTFGFTPVASGDPVGVSMQDGVLRLTEGMAADTDKSVKYFDPIIAAQSAVKLEFDWSSLILQASGKTGIEFRDSYGRLVFAISGCYNSKARRYELRYAVEGSAIALDSTQEPVWIGLTMTPSAAYHFALEADFQKQRINLTITDSASGTVLYSGQDLPTTASALSQMIACNYWTNNCAYDIVQTIDNFNLWTSDDDLPLAGKTVYAFGDSIVRGHKYATASFPNFVAENEAMHFSNTNKYASNGATVIRSSNWILTQVRNAPAAAPDYIIFNGGINDAYPTTTLGTVSSGKDLSMLDTSTFAGAFEELVGTMQAKWPTAKIIYVAVHKTNSREAQSQADVYALETAICDKWGVTVADIYSEDGLDCLNNPSNLTKYAFDALHSTTKLPVSNSRSATHPNFLAIEEFYVPVISLALRKAQLHSLHYNNLDKTADTYTAASWASFEAAMKTAEDVLNDKNAVQAQINAAFADLNAAIDALTSAKEGWALENGVWYYYRNDEKRTGWVESNGRMFYLDDDGAMQTDWVKVDGKWYYLDMYGAMQTGWALIDGKWYFLDNAGVMRTGWTKVSGKMYYLGLYGAMETGWALVDGKWYYMDANGVMQTGMTEVNGKLYYLGLYGAMQTGWALVDGKWYYMNANGAVVMGISMEINGVIYDFDSNGAWIE